MPIGNECPRTRKTSLRFEVLEDRSVPATITVTTAIDDISPNNGSVSLREAILAINAGNDLGDANIAAQSPGAFGTSDTINFNIAGSGVHTINVGADASALGVALPRITNSVFIDGYSQAGSSQNTLAVGDNAVLLIELNGGGIRDHGLQLTGGASTVQGLVINRFGANGIAISTGGNNVIRGNFIGTNATGTAALGNGFGFSGGTAISIGSSSANVLGGTSPADRNVISGNHSAIFIISLTPVSGNVIQGNYIGTDATGTMNLGNGGSIGVSATNTLIGGTTPGARNIIVGRTEGTGLAGTGISIDGSRAIGSIIQGNFIGTDVTGTKALGNFLHGIDLSGDVGTKANILIGGTTPGAGNVISGNNMNGIRFQGSANNYTVQGNFIGTDVTGTKVLVGSSFAGISFFAGARDNLIGGTTPGAGNVISGNHVGIIVGDAEVQRMTIQGNFIGTQADGISPLGNVTHGVVVTAGSFDNTIGGTVPGAGNVIAFNGGVGALIGRRPEFIGIYAAGSGNAVLGNSIFSNGKLGIDLGPEEGRTINDPGDGDTGPSNLQNHPRLISVINTPAGLAIHGTLNSTPNTTFRVEFFSNDVVDPTGFGEGRHYLDFVNVTTDANGIATFSVTLSASASPGQFVTATATDPGNNTSEFSAARAVSPPSASSAFFAVGTGDGGPGLVRVYNADGSLQRELDPYSGYTGAVVTAVGDMNNDGIADIITGATDAVSGHVKVFDGVTGEELYSFLTFEGFAGGIVVAADDLNGDGYSDIVVGAASGSGGHVKAFDGRTGLEMFSFIAFPGWGGSITIAAGDIDGDGYADIIVGASGSAGDHLKAYSGFDGSLLRSFLAFPDSADTFYLAAGDINGDGFADIIVGMRSNASDSLVTIFSGVDGSEMQSFMPFSDFTGEVRVAANDLNGDGQDDIIAGAGPGAANGHAKVFDGNDLTQINSFYAFPDFDGGVFVG